MIQSDGLLDDWLSESLDNCTGRKKLIKQLADLTEGNDETFAAVTPPSSSSSPSPSRVATRSSVDSQSSRPFLDGNERPQRRKRDQRRGVGASERRENDPDIVVSFPIGQNQRPSSMSPQGSSPASENSSDHQTYIESIRRHPGEVEFFRLLHSEFHKAVYFFDRAIDEFSIREERVRFGMNIIRHQERVQLWSIFARSVFRLYTDLLLLETFCIMTYCSFSKILKKHDKHTGFETKNAFMANVVNNANFTHYTTLQQMIDRCQEVYSEVSDQLEREGQEGLHEDER
jgi:hypothetical protein